MYKNFSRYINLKFHLASSLPNQQLITIKIVQIIVFKRR
jgi:hypothetical protein